MSSTSRLILIFTVAFAVLIMAPAFLSQQFSPYPFMKTGDVLDIFCPLVLIPLYWLLFRLGKPPSTREMVVFLVFVALWVEGQGMHLGANSIGHLIGEFEGSDAQLLTHFYDEVLSHYLWHIGMVGMTTLLLWRQARNPLPSLVASIRTEVVCAVIYGIVSFIIVIEAGTVPLGLPFAAIVAVVGLVSRSEWRAQPVAAFFYLAHGLALILFAIWFVRWGGFPQFSELGLI